MTAPALLPLIVPETAPALLTPHQAKYFAFSLTRRSVDDGDRLSRALFDAAVDLNPHQIEAALFALQSPFSKGVLLADEVGLGKTIEAGIVLCQLWAERRRRLVVVCPASLRPQWAAELREKFNLPAVVVDARTARLARQAAQAPLAPGAVVVMSYQYANRIREDVRGVDWDLVVIDEAQNLRNAYQPSNQIGQGVRWATQHCRKLLLSATPLQNSLKELYGLSTLIDERLFGDLPSFQEQFMGAGADLNALRQRLATFCKRTLRKQVTEYVNYTQRRAITRPFRPTDNEHALYEAVSDFLRRPASYAVPHRQRHLTELLLRKLLASSAVAIADTLDTMRKRLEALLRQAQNGARVGVAEPGADSLVDELLAAEELDQELLDEILSDYEEAETGTETGTETGGLTTVGEPAALDYARLREEIGELGRLAAWARRLGTDTKAQALTQALRVGFEQLATMGANRKALIFTESRRTQEFLRTYLEREGYAGQLVLFNGTNNGPEAAAIYERWLGRHRGTDRVSGSRAVDMRAALVEYFRDEASILIATEAAAEGINLQFCSLVINYDLPWNPQRVEQRIGRCHRYGQRHEVVVINFLNERNHADQRVLELLTEKFQLFSSIFEASDEVIGAIESGVDFERRILAIYQQCRTHEEIEAAFRRLRAELDEQIKARMADTRQLLFEHFDEDVHQRLRLRLEDARQQLDRFGARFWALTHFQLRERAHFDDARLRFELHRPPQPKLAPGRYYLISRQQPEPETPTDLAGGAGPTVPAATQAPADGFLYRLSHPLGEYVVDSAKLLPTPLEDLVFDVTHHPTRLHAVEALRGRAGYLTLTRLCLTSTADSEQEEYLLFSAFDETGESVDQETSEKLLSCAARATGAPVVLPGATTERLRGEAERYVQATISASLERNSRYFQEAREKLQRWADDLVVAAEKALRDTKEQIRQQEREARLATTLAGQHTIQEKIRTLERQQRRQRHEIFEAEDAIRERRDELIGALEKRLVRTQTVEALFTVRWAVV